MKKSLVLSAILFAILGLTACSLPSLAAPLLNSASAAPDEPQLKTIRGTVKADGDKLTFVTDDDNKSWIVMNPETLKGHEGHHVELNVHLYAEKGVIHVHSVKMLNDEKK